MAGERTGRWAAILAVLAAGLSACGGDDQSAVDPDACKGAEAVRAATLVPGAPYRARPVPKAQAGEIATAFEVEGARTDTTQVVDTRDRATFVLAAATSTGEQVRSVDVFAGFADAAGEVEETEMGGEPARIARSGGFTRIITTKDCSAITLIGADEQPTRRLAAALKL